MITDEYGLKERHEELLQMLKDVDSLMKNNNIRYSLSGGTLLGAIRHNGFIPWDDDIDIMLDRPNFEKLLRVFGDSNYTINISTPQAEKKISLRRILWIYRIQMENDKREGLSAAIADVGVLDKSPNSSIKRHLKVFAIKVLQGMMHESIKSSNHSPVMRICLLITFTIGRLFPDHIKYRWYDRISKSDNAEDARYLSQYNDLFSTLSCRFDADIMDNIEDHVFEDTTLPIISKYDNYLTVLYGDYMVPPKQEDRVPMHIKNSVV